MIKKELFKFLENFCQKLNIKIKEILYFNENILGKKLKFLEYSFLTKITLCVKKNASKS